MTSTLRLLALVLFLLPLMARAQSPDAPGRAAPAPVEAPGDVEGTGTLDPMHIREVVQARREDIRRCYQAGASQNPMLEGVVTFRFEIARQGRVSSVAVERDTLGSNPVVKCMTRVIQGLRFDPPEGGGTMVVRYPFRFKVG